MDVPARIFEWTEGDVYLTHKLCAGLARDVPEGAILMADVDRAARRHLYEDEVFRKMWRQVQADDEIAALIQKLLEHRDTVRFTLLQRHIMVAWLEGAIKSDTAGFCVLHSLVHESVFYSMQRTQPDQSGCAERNFCAWWVACSHAGKYSAPEFRSPAEADQTLQWRTIPFSGYDQSQ